MAADLAHVEWLNENSLRAYPFSENCSRRPNDGQGGKLSSAYAIPNYMFVDFIVTVPDSVTDRLYLRSLSYAGRILTFVVASVSDGTIIASSSIELGEEAEPNLWHRFSGSGPFVDVRGAVVIGDPERVFNEFPDGIYEFSPEETTFETRCVRPALAGVSSIRATDEMDTYSTKRLQGDVALIAGDNIRLRYDESMNAIWIDADSNAGYNEECVCETKDTCIHSINGVTVEDVRIEGGDCISITVEEGVITITDTCAKPCCGCEELTYLNQKTSEITTTLDKLRSYVDLVQDRIDELKFSNMMSTKAVQ